MLNEIAGYILCAASTPDFVKDYNEKYVPGLNLPTKPSGAVADRMRGQIKNGDRMLKGLEKNWPAHLHFNITNEWQRFGLGAHLIEKLLEKLKKEGMKGVHVRILGYDYPRMADYSRSERFRDLEKAGFREFKNEGSERWFVKDLYLFIYFLFIY
jgi:GNAT superfamily N-acetyltransferase